MSEIKSALNMDKLVFDKILFDRKGFKNKNQVKYSIESRIAQHQQEEIYRVTLILKGDKEDEYDFEISLTGFFTFDEDANVDEETKKILIGKNTVAIMMPYMRSQVSLLTAQPGMDCVVLPAFNINNIVNDDDEDND